MCFARLIFRRLVRAWLVVSEDETLFGGCNRRLSDLPPAWQLSPSKGSHATSDHSKMPFAGVLEASSNASWPHFDIYIGLMQSARDSAPLNDAAWQRVSLSCRTPSPILLRQIPHNYHRIEACAPFQAQSARVDF